MYFVDFSVYVQKELQGTFSPLANKQSRVNHVWPKVGKHDFKILIQILSEIGYL